MQKPGLFGMNGFIVLLLTLFAVVAKAQQPAYLILVDADNKMPFTMRVGDQLYSSTAHGHLALSHLKDSTYKLNLRFPRKNMNEQVFPVKLRGRDLGFQLKGSDTTWVLYNWQTKETVRPVYELDSSRILAQGVKREDGFSRLMAAVVNDTSVMYNTYLGSGFGKDSARGAETLARASRLKPAAAGSLTSVKKGQKPAAVKPGIPVSDSSVVKTSVTAAVIPAVLPPESKTVATPPISEKTATPATVRPTDSLQAAPVAYKPLSRRQRKDSVLAAKKLEVFNDSVMTARKIQAVRDSVFAAQRAVVVHDSLMAVQQKALEAQQLAAQNAKSGTHRKTSLSNVRKLREVSLKVSRKMIFLDRGRDGKSDTVTLFVYFETPEERGAKPAPAILTPQPVEVTSQPPAPAPVAPKEQPVAAPDDAGNACSRTATEEDLDFVRSAILRGNSESEKIAAASGAFSMKCFSVSQLRVLAGLFVSEKARYKLMEAARTHISDRSHFAELADMYSDKGLQRKFLALADKRS